MKQMIGLVLVLLGIVLGAYVGIYILFIGGICDFITAVKKDVVIPSEIAWSVAKVVFSQLFGSIAALVMIAPGVALLNDD